MNTTWRLTTDRRERLSNLNSRQCVVKKRSCSDHAVEAEWKIINCVKYQVTSVVNLSNSTRFSVIPPPYSLFLPDSLNINYANIRKDFDTTFDMACREISVTK